MAPPEGTGRRAFPAFPFDPYPIQLDFMDSLYSALDNGGVAMLESPTGTGKTLSIICSTLQWLLDRRRCPNTHPAASVDPSDAADPDWLRDFVVDPLPLTTKERSVRSSSRTLSAGRAIGSRSERGVEEEGEFLLDEYESEEEGAGDGRSKRKSSGWSSSDDEDGDWEEEEVAVEPKVYFCSRTHSQLSQFVKELRRTRFVGDVRIACLGSRKNLCINSDVLKMRSSNLINERCLELQRNKTKKESKIEEKPNGKQTRPSKTSCGCPMLRKEGLKREFKDEASKKALDIEDLVQLGSKIGTCPYYGSRNMVPRADLVVLPYQSLLLKSSRDSLDLKLKNSVIIIDEAHNLADSLTNMYNSRITLSQLDQVHSHLELYFNKFQKLLGAGNRRYIQTLMVITRSFIRLLLNDQNGTDSLGTCTSESVEKPADVVSITINELLFALDIDNINMLKVLHYIKESKIVYKVTGYGVKQATLESDHQNLLSEEHSESGFQALVDVLTSLTNSDLDGRIIVSRQQSTCFGQPEERYIKFVMLSGEKIFSEIMNQAHAIVLAGGTLQPIEETQLRLFPMIPLSQVHFFSCNHIVPAESILPIIIGRGPSGTMFDFSYNSRSTSAMIMELGRLLCNLASVVPEGIVMFFSSFDYLGQVFDHWKDSGILERIQKRKRVFREPKSNADVEHILNDYKVAINDLSVSGSDSGPRGALLMAVVGGKVSEGINFSDGMARCVIMVGLPYASPSDLELMERIHYIEGLGGPTTAESVNKIHMGNSVRSGFHILRNCSRNGRAYYENLCMKAVNQSIGRAIRHINDYAAVLLVDSRYASSGSKANFSNPSDKLPHWIKSRLVCASEGYGQVHRLLHQFFQFNKHR